MLGVEAAGHGLDGDEHAASLLGGFPGVLHGNKTYLLQDDDGQITEGHSISAGLDYPGIGPEHAWLKDMERVEYTAITDEEALEAFQLLCRTEGIIPALEPSHAIAAVAKRAKEMPKEQRDPRQFVRPGRQGHLHRRGKSSGWRCEVRPFGTAVREALMLSYTARSMSWEAHEPSPPLSLPRRESSRWRISRFSSSGQCNTRSMSQTFAKLDERS